VPDEPTPIRPAQKTTKQKSLRQLVDELSVALEDSQRREAAALDRADTALEARQGAMEMAIKYQAITVSLLMAAPDIGCHHAEPDQQCPGCVWKLVLHIIKEGVNKD
jgi:predicted kinase